MKKTSPRMLFGPAVLAALGCALFAVSPLFGSGPDDLAVAIPRAVTGIWMWLALAWLATRACDVLLSRVAIASPSLTYPRLLNDLLRAALFGAAALIIPVAVFGYPTSGFVTVSSVAIAVVGFGLRNVMSDLFSGIAVGLDHIYRTGDWIETIGGAAGRVAEIGWRTTQLVDRNGFVIVLPNGAIAGQRLNNYSDGSRDYRTSLRVPLDPLLPVARAKRILLSGALDAGRTIPGMSPDVLLIEFVDGAAIYLVRFRVPDFGREQPCRDAVASRIMNALHCAGQAIRSTVPFDRATQPVMLPPRDGLLAHVDLFRGFDAAEREAIAGKMRRLEVAAGEVVFRQGDTGDFLCVLGEGILDVEVGREDADPVRNRIAPGEVFGEIALLTGQPRTATITAALDSVIYEIHRQHLDPIMKRRPELADGLAAVMAEHLDFNERTIQRSDPAPPPTRDDLRARLRLLFGLPLTPK